MAKNNDAAPSEQLAQATASQGVRARRAIMMREFIPSQDFVAKNVIGPGKGTLVILGRVFGFVTGITEKAGKLPNGEPSVSIVANGQFETENYHTGEVSQASAVYLPNAAAEALKAQFAADPDVKLIEIDMDVGLEATGKTIPYSWYVANHVEGQAATPLKALKSRRGRPANAVALAAPAAQKQLTVGQE